uniref:Uncharacterized protein n=1 Tax=Sphaerodactylus townsendi TaxID=933632 RepID=A0ACB8EE07_9SAUR
MGDTEDLKTSTIGIGPILLQTENRVSRQPFSNPYIQDAGVWAVTMETTQMLSQFRDLHGCIFHRDGNKQARFIYGGRPEGYARGQTGSYYMGLDQASGTPKFSTAADINDTLGFPSPSSNVQGPTHHGSQKHTPNANVTAIEVLAEMSGKRWPDRVTIILWQEPKMAVGFTPKL